jgi:subtilisin family serine protease
MKTLRLALVALAVVLASCGPEPSTVTAPDGNATMQKGDGIDLTNRWIVVFNDNVKDVDATVDELVGTHGGTVHYRYRHAIKGMALTIPEQALKGLARNPNIAYIEADAMAYANVDQTVGSSLWGLDRIDQTSLPLNQTYSYVSDGTGVRVYIVDTGIRTSHTQFGGRAVHGYDYVNYDADATDDNGHGTHCAGTVGGSTVGVAKNVTLVAVKVLSASGSGSWSGVIAGIDYVRAQHGVTGGPSVMSMSLGGGASSTVDNAVNNCINAGVTAVVAAGNDNANAGNYSPARVANALTIGSSTNTDARSSFSNYGSVVDLFAPGSSIYSTWYTSNTAYATLSGTSMATPHVAGVAALYLQANPSATPAQVADAIKNQATPNVLSSIGTGSPNLLLYSLVGGTPPPPQPAPAAPTNLTASAASSSQINLTWTDNATTETGFYVERALSATGPWTRIATLGANAVSYSSTGLSATTTYHYQVQAYNGGGTSSYSSIASATTQSAPGMYVSAVSVSKKKSGSTWTATLSVTVRSGGSLVSGASVSANWTGGASGSTVAVTSSKGVATIKTSNLSYTAVQSINMSVTNITKTGLTYQPSANLVSFPITVTRP